MKVLLYNLFSLSIFLVIAAIVGEIFLHYDGRYADLVDENLVRSRAIWDRPANATQSRKHPDLNFKVKLLFNDFKIRNHQGVSLKDVENYQGKLVGVFGDSMTENRRISDKFTFTSLLNETLKPDYMVLNFGIDGYGLDQSYLKYLDFKEKTKLDHVFYIFLRNDFRNIYENQLFSFRNNKVGEPIAPKINPFIDFIRKFHISYLMIDSYARIKAKVADESYTSHNLNEKIVSKFSSNNTKMRRDLRHHDEYADSIVKDYLSDTPTKLTLKWAKRFRMLLSAWKSEVESHNATFTIFVIPNQVSTDLADKLFGKQFTENTVYLIDDFPEGYNNFTFKNDNHWNELGNLRAAQAIVNWGGKSKYWLNPKKKLDIITEQTEAEINKLYNH